MGGWSGWISAGLGMIEMNGTPQIDSIVGVRVTLYFVAIMILCLALRIQFKPNSLLPLFSGSPVYVSLLASFFMEAA